MTSRVQSILICEPDLTRAQLYVRSLRDCGMAESSPDIFDHNTVEVQIVYNCADALEIIKHTILDAVFMAHQLSPKQTSETLLPKLLELSPDCEIFLTSENAMQQRNAVNYQLDRAGIALPPKQIKHHQMSDVDIFENFMNKKIRSPLVKIKQPKGHELE